MLKLLKKISFVLSFFPFYCLGRDDLDIKPTNDLSPVHCAICAEKYFMNELLLANGTYFFSATKGNGESFNVAQAENQDRIIKRQTTTGGKTMNSANTDLDNAERALENEDIEKAFKIAKKHAEDGDARAQLFYGKLFVMKFMLENYGKDYDRNQEIEEKQAFTTALSWIKKAAEQNYAEAQGALGMMYAEGNGVPADPILGHMWLILSTKGDKSKLEGVKRSSEQNYDMTDEEFSQAQHMADEWNRGR